MSKDKQDCADPVQALHDFIVYNKVAVAVAIIRSKPSGLSGQQYAAQLCGRYQRSLLEWQREAGRLQEEVLGLKQTMLRQELLNRRVQDTNLHSGGNMDWEESDDLVFPTPPSSSEICHQQASVTMTTSQNPVTMTTSQNAGRFTEHAQFLSSILSLKSLPTSGIFTTQNIESTVIESMKKSLDTIQKWLCDDMALSEKMVENTVDIIVKVLNEETWLKHFSVGAICGQVLDFVKTLLVNIMEKEDLNCFKRQQRLSSVILTLSQSHKLQRQILTILTHCIKDYSELLRQVIKNTAVLEPHKFENIFYVIRIEEQILEQLVALPRRHSVDKAFCEQLKAQLEDSLLHIWKEFPLFAHYIWQLEGLLHNIQIQKQNSH